MKSLLMIVTLLAVIFTIACKKTAPESVSLPPLVKPPFPEFDPEFRSFSFDVAAGQSMELSSGTVINIPPQALVDNNGQVVKGTAELKFRELSDAAAIYLAGIPMTYKQGHFETAGSFEIRVEQNGKPLFLDSTQQVMVKLASFQTGDDYDFFYLNEEKRGWDSLGTAPPQVNLDKKKFEKKINKMKPRIKFPLNRQYFAFNYKAILDVYYNNNLTNVNHPYAQKKMKAYGLGWTDIHTYQAIQYKGKREMAALMVWRNISRKEFPEWTKDKVAKLELIKGNRYKLKIATKDSTQVFSTHIEAVMPLKALFAYGPGYWKNDYAAAMKKVEEAYTQMAQMAEVYRSFAIDDFGIYNWDRLMKEDDKLILAADFQLDTSSIANPMYQPEIVYITGNNSGLIKYPQEKWSEMALVADPNARMFAILPGRQIVIYPADKYAEIEFEDLRKMEAPAYVFDMEKVEKPMESIDDLRKALRVYP